MAGAQQSRFSRAAQDAARAEAAAEDEREEEQAEETEEEQPPKAARRGPSPAAARARKDGYMAGFDAALAHAAQLMDLCAVAHPDPSGRGIDYAAAWSAASEFVAKRTPMASAQKALLRDKAARTDKAGITGHHDGRKPSAYARLEQAAAAIRAADPKLSVAQAFDRACLQNKPLYAEYRQEQRVARGR